MKNSELKDNNLWNTPQPPADSTGQVQRYFVYPH
jgi:hypothetical protein